MSDPLSQWRRNPIPAKKSAGADSPPITPQGARNSYRAYEGKDNVMRLLIKRANAPERSPLYADLADVISDGRFGTNFVLLFGVVIASVRGKNLQELVTSLRNHTIDFIQEFDPDLWDLPSDSSVPIIESIEIHVPDGSPNLDTNEATKKTKH